MLASEEVCNHGFVTLDVATPFNAGSKVKRFFLPNLFFRGCKNVWWRITPVDIQVLVESVEDEAIELISILLAVIAPLTVDAGTKCLDLG